MQAPRDHWNPALLVLDEAHLFAPEQGKAESVAAVIDVATRGSKRGLALVAATQRLSKLHKDVAAELLNKLIGRTGLDVDVRRAGDELGMTARDAMAAVRELDPGEFFAFGPALTRSVTRFRIGDVATTHPKVGDRLMLKTPAPSRKVLNILQELGDLPKEAEEEAMTLDHLRAENESLKRQIAALKKSQSALSEADLKAQIAKAVSSAAAEHDKTLRAISDIIGNALAQKKSLPTPPPAVLPKSSPVLSRQEKAPPRGDITGPQQRILDAMPQLAAMGITDLHKSQVAAVAGVSPGSGSYANNLGRLRTLGLIDYPQPSFIQFTAEGRRQARAVTTPLSVEDLHEAWLGIVTNPQQKILREVLSPTRRRSRKTTLLRAWRFLPRADHTPIIWDVFALSGRSTIQNRDMCGRRMFCFPQSERLRELLALCTNQELCTVLQASRRGPLFACAASVKVNFLPCVS